MSFIKVECLDTREARILFGVLRKTYNTTLKGSRNPYANIIPEALKVNTEQTAKAVKYHCNKNNQEAQLSRKKRGKLGSLQIQKTTIKINNGTVEFKTKANEIKLKLTLKDSGVIKDGVYTECYLSFDKNTPILEINRAKVRFAKPGISLKNLEKALTNKARKEISELAILKQFKIRKAKQAFDRFGKTSDEFIKAFKDVEVSEKENTAKAKLNLYLYIEELNKKYSTIGLTRTLFGENQAENVSSACLTYAPNTVDFVFEKYCTSLLSEQEQKELRRILQA